MKINSISIIIPCYNEEPTVLKKTVDDIVESFGEENIKLQIIIVNDGSKDYDYGHINFPANVELIRHTSNRGYGAALKTGIKNANYSWIGITDADNTYPNNNFYDLLKNADDADMVIGARKWDDISFIRRYPKKILTIFSSFLSGENIIDLNSGMRIFKKDLAQMLWYLFPNGFSFTSTLTMGAITNDKKIKFHEIEYFSRIGNSSIHPIKDTFNFFYLVTRLSLYFNPKKFFIPISLVLLVLAIARGTRDYLAVGSFGGLTLILFFMAFQVFFFGLLAEIINKTRLFLNNSEKL